MRLLLAALGVLSLLGSGSPQPDVQTVYQDTSGPITAFAADGALLAWFERGAHRCNAVHVVSLTGVKVTLPKQAARNVTCRWSVGDGPVSLAVAEKTVGALWTLKEEAQINLDYVVGADASHPRERRFDQVAHTPAGAGRWLGGIAGNGSTLVYAVTEVGYVDQVACLSGGSCRLKLTGGAIHQVVGRRNPAVPDTGPAVAVAVAAGRVAYIPADDIGPGGLPLATADAPIPVRSARTGELVTSIAPDGLALGIALAPHVLALLVRRGEQTSVAWYDPADGTLLGSVSVPQATSPRLAASDTMIVYTVGKALYAIDLTGASAQKLLATPVTPFGVSVDDNRVLWAENVDGLGRIRSLVVG
ncbi:MAG TPA: hypothetical protein VNH40_09460 [Gaiellaceae bacterium]|nr:hypothetical protein [Gaiellaceae bacterium]